MKSIEFHGRSLETIKSFPPAVRRTVGHQLDRVQRGLKPVDWRPMPSIGKGVQEIRIQWKGQFRIIFVTNPGYSVLVLHAFQKKSQRTNATDIDRARTAFKQAKRR